MPDGRKALLLSGLSALIIARVIFCKKKTHLKQGVEMPPAG